MNTYKKIDGVNYVSRPVPSANGVVDVPGITVRALRRALESADPDAMVTYVFEQGEVVNFGVIAGAAIGNDLVALIGPEVATGLKEAGYSAEESCPVAPTPEPPPVDRSAKTTTNGTPYDPLNPNGGTRADGMHERYVVLTEEERAKGFVRPVRDAYKHLTCGTVTTMGRSIAETYARDPKFYGATYCVKCQKHLPVGEQGEFVWYENDGSIGPKVGV
jgi:hypothetical protein